MKYFIISIILTYSFGIQLHKRLISMTNFDNGSIMDIAHIACKKAGLRILEGSETINLQNDVISKIGSRDIVTKVTSKTKDV